MSFGEFEESTCSVSVCFISNFRDKEEVTRGWDPLVLRLSYLERS